MTSADPIETEQVAKETRPGERTTKSTTPVNPAVTPKKGIEEAQKAAEAVMATSSSVLVLPVTVGTELYRFGTRRMAAALEHVQRLTQCKEPSEAFDTHYAFLSRTLDDYAQEAARIQAVMREAVEQATPKLAA